MTRVRLVALAAVIGLMAGCAPGIRVSRVKPSRYNLGTTRTVAVTHVGGHPAAASQVMVKLQQAVVDAQYHQLINALDRGITISIGGLNARVDIGGGARVPADVYVVANVMRYEVLEERRSEQKAENGRIRDITKITPEAHARVSFQVVKGDGRVIVFRDYSGDASGSSFEAGERRGYSSQELLEKAIEEAVESFVYDITPRRVVEKIELDDDDERLEIGIERAKDGDLSGAERSWNEVLKVDPHNPGATYNLGVLLETRGDFDGAAAAYQKAFERAPKPLYRDALNDLNQRLRDADALQQNI